ncbi:hypothetical protein LX87_02503 [Larkinella arboricola]|uniref:Uncharacterized protein n=1 Tax=Larkinella arboricola TaxID=643671 RepID=A0A327WYH6_LARAB|nr:hypothetical protein LX87_02503 [Larkinella arboricola]
MNEGQRQFDLSKKAGQESQPAFQTIARCKKILPGNCQRTGEFPSIAESNAVKVGSGW